MHDTCTHIHLLHSKQQALCKISHFKCPPQWWKVHSVSKSDTKDCRCCFRLSMPMTQYSNVWSSIERYTMPWITIQKVDMCAEISLQKANFQFLKLLEIIELTCFDLTCWISTRCTICWSEDEPSLIIIFELQYFRQVNIGHNKIHYDTWRSVLILQDKNVSTPTSMSKRSSLHASFDASPSQYLTISSVTQMMRWLLKWKMRAATQDYKSSTCIWNHNVAMKRWREATIDEVLSCDSQNRICLSQADKDPGYLPR